MSEDDSIPISVRRYLEVPLAPDGDLAGQLYERVASEASSPTIPLSAEFSESGPSYLTHSMRDWFDSRVLPLRNAAMSALYEEFRRDSKDGVPTTIREVDLDAIQLDGARKKRQSVERFKVAGGPIATELQAKRSEYQNIRATEGRDAKPINRLRDFVVLSILALPELLMNFSSFVKIEYLNPFFAGAICFVVAVAIALASHVHGESLKQASTQFGEHVPETIRRRHRILFWIATSLLILAFGLVAWGRYVMLADAIREASLLGGSAFNGYVLFLGAMLGNVIVYVIGLIFVYMVTDPVPGFAEIQRDMRALEKKYDGVFIRELERPLKQVLAEEREKMTARENRELSHQGAANYQSNRRLLSLVQAQDSNVLAVLREYRSRLRMAIRERQPHAGAPEPAVFSVETVALDDIRRGDFRVLLTPSQYAEREIRLGYPHD